MAAEGVLKDFLAGAQLPQLRLEAAIRVSQRRLTDIDDLIEQNHWVLITDAEWDAISEDLLSVQQFKQRKHDEFIEKLHKHKKKTSTPQPVPVEEHRHPVDPALFQTAQETLAALQEKFPQCELNGASNVWIVKPAGLSRGRGIACYSSLPEIMDHINKEGM